MKKLLYLPIALFVAFLIAEGCQKITLPVNHYQLIATKTTVKYGEPDSLILLGAEHDTVSFSVTPTGLAGLFKKDNKALVIFSQAGTYTVSATPVGGSTYTKVITVLNENYYPPIVDTPSHPQPPRDTTYIIPISGDVVVTPKLYKLPNIDSTGFILTFKSSNTYACGNSWFNITSSQINNNYVVNIPNVSQPGATQCAKPNMQIGGMTDFFPEVAYPVTLGTTYPLTIKVGGTAYTGVITFGKTYMDIVWNYTSGVTFTATHITL